MRIQNSNNDKNCKWVLWLRFIRQKSHVLKIVLLKIVVNKNCA